MVRGHSVLGLPLRKLAKMQIAPKTFSVLDSSMHIAWISSRVQNINVVGAGCSTSSAQAVFRARTEYHERESQVLAGSRMIVTKEPIHAIPLNLFSKQVPADSNVKNWVTGRDLLKDKRIDIPAQIIFLGWEPKNSEQPIVQQSSIGTATHQSREKAECAALGELLERDILTRFFDYGDDRFRLVDESRFLEASLPHSAVRAFERANLTFSGFVFEELPFNLSLVAIHESGGNKITFGSAIRPSKTGSLLHALEEAIAVRISLAISKNKGELEKNLWNFALSVSLRGKEYLARIFRNVYKGSAASEKVHPTTMKTLLSVAADMWQYSPLAVDLPVARNALCVVKVVCPGASIYRTINEKLPDLPNPVA